jgi:SPP1 gp7 family putative phage head morphogenesis protein
LATANEIYFDAAIRHQIGLRRFSTTEIKRMLTLLQRADADLTEKLRARLGRVSEASRSDFTSDRLKALLADVKVARVEALRELKTQTKGTMYSLGKNEVVFEQKMIQSSVPVELSFATVSTATIKAALFSQPFQGKMVTDWFTDLTKSDIRRLTQTIQLGVVEGQTTDDIVRSVIGTRANGYTDGILSTTRREAEAVVRTALNHTSNAARETVWDNNADIIQNLRWTSTLDGRTSAVCRARDGEVYPIDSGPRPPAHPNCRSIMVAVLDGVGIVGKRPFVADIRTPDERETDFRALAKEQGVSIGDVRSAWADKVIGRVPSETTYQQWLTRQSAAFQDEVLGKTKGALFRRGGLQLDQFIDRAGNELSLEQLKATTPWAFDAANIDLDDV